MLLENEELLDHSQAVTLTYTEAYTLNESAFEDVANASPIVWRKVHRAMRRVALTRALIRGLNNETKDWKPRSFVPRSAASGYETASNQLDGGRKSAWEKKMDKMLVNYEGVASFATRTLKESSMPSTTSGGASGATTGRKDGQAAAEVTLSMQGGGGGNGHGVDPERFEELCLTVRTLAASVAATAASVARIEAAVVARAGPHNALTPPSSEPPSPFLSPRLPEITPPTPSSGATSTRSSAIRLTA